MLPGEIVGEKSTQCSECGDTLEIRVCQSEAGYYLGFWCDNDGPYSRETGYWATESEAEEALETFRKTGMLPNERW